jgi:hypothetical protein
LLLVTKEKIVEMKKIETNTIKSVFGNYAIKNEELANILGGLVSLYVKCSGREQTLKKSDWEKNCAGSDRSLSLACNMEATLCAVIVQQKLPLVIHEISYKPIAEYSAVLGIEMLL